MREFRIHHAGFVSVQIGFDQYLADANRSTTVSQALRRGGSISILHRFVFKWVGITDVCQYLFHGLSAAHNTDAAVTPLVLGTFVVIAGGRHYDTAVER